MKQWKFIYILSLVFFIQCDIFGQTYLTPYVGFTSYEISNNENLTIEIPEFVGGINNALGFGFLIEHRLVNQFNLKMDLGYEKLGINSTGAFVSNTVFVIDNDPYFRPAKYVHNKYSFSIGAGFDITDELNISYLYRIIRTPRVKYKDDILKRMDDIVYKSDLLEFAHRLELSYKVKNVMISAYYSHTIRGISNTTDRLTNESYRGNNTRIDPRGSFGLKVGYRFKVLDRLRKTKKTKVDCPSF